jgi:hypothetical protein
LARTSCVATRMRPVFVLLLWYARVDARAYAGPLLQDVADGRVAASFTVGCCVGGARSVRGARAWFARTESRGGRHLGPRRPRRELFPSGSKDPAFAFTDPPRHDHSEHPDRRSRQSSFLRERRSFARAARFPLQGTPFAFRGSTSPGGGEDQWQQPDSTASKHGGGSTPPARSPRGSP